MTKKNKLIKFFEENKEQFTYDSIWWYSEMSTTISNLGNDFMKDCAMFSLMSINCSLERNIIKFEEYANTGKFKGLCPDKFDKLLIAETEIEMWNILGGRKIQNFFMNLYQPLNPNYVTIDRWSARLVGHDKNLSSKQYNMLAQVYFNVAQELNILPNQLQAATWVAYRNKMT